MQAGLAAINRRPARPHHRRHTGHGARKRGADKQRPVRRLQATAQQHDQQARQAKQRCPRQDPPLPVAVDQPRDLRREQGISQHKGRGDRTGQGKATAQLGQQGDDADPGHGQRHPGNQAGQDKALRPRDSKQCSIGILHG